VTERVRVDKWLWAARFFKTRGLAAEAIQGGRVHLGGVRAKPAKEVRVGDMLDITIGQTPWTVVVRAVSERRGPASEAALLYEETAESRERRERLAAERRVAPPPGSEFRGRPTKRDRRRIEAIRAALDPTRRGKGRGA
jgi:ribosome-associated heat shock protein Hsp15